MTKKDLIALIEKYWSELPEEFMNEFKNLHEEEIIKKLLKAVNI